MDRKYKYLLKNIGVLTISNFGSKILSFLLIPLYTSILSVEQYGTYDLYSTTISLLVPILSLNIVQSVMRFSLDKNSDKKIVFTIGLRRIITASIIFCIIVFINYAFNIIEIFNHFTIYFILLFISGLIYSLFSKFSRGCENVRDLAIAGVINSLIMLLANILFLVVLKLGITGYFLANILAHLISSIYLFIRLKLWNYISFFSNDKSTRIEMEKYSKPLILSSISWWITNVSDRYIITWLCGVAANGIYSVAYKIPSILNIFQDIFNQAWSISAVKEFDSKNSSFFSNIYAVYNCGMVIICSILIIFNKVIAKILFANEFYLAWQYAPLLMISTVFGALSGLLGGLFNASKKSRVLAKTTIVGAIVNIIFNIILVKFIGTIGAAIATVISYIIVWILRYIETKRILNIKINLVKDILAYIILFFQIIIYFLNFNFMLLYLFQLILITVIIIIYRNQLLLIIKKIYNYFRGKNDRIESK